MEKKNWDAYRKNHRKEHYDTIPYIVNKGEREEITKAAAAMGYKSRNDFIDQCVKEKLAEYRYQTREEFRNKARNTQARKSPYKECIYYAIKTTGNDFIQDEILQIAIIDSEGSTLLNETVSPLIRAFWTESVYSGCITPEIAKNAEIADIDLIGRTKGLFNSADLVIGLYPERDMEFLSVWDVQRPIETTLSLMRVATLNQPYNPSSLSLKILTLEEACTLYNVECHEDTALNTAQTILKLHKAINQQTRYQI